MNITLLINGEQADFETTMKRLVKEALAENQCTAPATNMPEFAIDPNFTYRLSDDRLKSLFGVTELKHPEQSIINALRAVGIDPIKRGRLGSLVYGYQLVNYLDKLNEKHSNYEHKN